MSAILDLAQQIADRTVTSTSVLDKAADRLLDQVLQDRSADEALGDEMTGDRFE